MTKQISTDEALAAFACADATSAVAQASGPNRKERRRIAAKAPRAAVPSCSCCHGSVGRIASAPDE
jgi:hypothetical protein